MFSFLNNCCFSTVAPDPKTQHNEHFATSVAIVPDQAITGIRC